MQWIDRFENALDSLVDSVSARSFAGQDLTNRQYRQLAQRAMQDITTRRILLTYQLVFNSDISKATELLCEHEIIESILEDQDGQNEFGVGGLQTFMIYGDAKGLLADLLAGLVRAAIQNGTRITIANLQRTLSSGEERTLPGYEATLVAGAALPGRWDIADGLYAVPYAKIQAKLDPLSLWQHDPPISNHDKENMIAIVRDFRWGPAVFKGPHNDTKIFVFKNDVQQIFDLLEIVIARRLRPVAQCDRVEDWIADILPTLDHAGMSYPFGHSKIGARDDIDQLGSVELSQEEKSEYGVALASFLQNSQHEKKFSIPISRLGNSLRRRGSLVKEDELIDAAIALEALYEVEGAELTNKLSTRAAWFLGKNVDQRMEIHKEVKDIYNARSRVVHGRNVRAQDTEMADRAFDLARRTLMKRVRSHELSKTNWDKIVLGAVSDEQAG